MMSLAPIIGLEAHERNFMRSRKMKFLKSLLVLLISKKGALMNNSKLCWRGAIGPKNTSMGSKGT
jgi:hypothetical protein